MCSPRAVFLASGRVYPGRLRFVFMSLASRERFSASRPEYVFSDRSGSRLAMNKTAGINPAARQDVPLADNFYQKKKPIPPLGKLPNLNNFGAGMGATDAGATGWDCGGTGAGCAATFFTRCGVKMTSVSRPVSDPFSLRTPHRRMAVCPSSSRTVACTDSSFTTPAAST